MALMCAFSMTAVLAAGCANTAGTGTGSTAAGTKNAGTASAETKAPGNASGSVSGNAAGASVNSTDAVKSVTVRSDGTDLTKVYDKDDLNTGVDKDATTIKLSGTEASVSGPGASFKNGTLTITKAGTYVLSGELTAGQVLIDADKDAVVHLVLNGVKINSTVSAAINGKKAKKIVVTLADGTTNELTDARDYTYDNADGDEPDAALFVKNDLTLNGSGTLKITANKKGIHAKDNLVVLGGGYEISSADDCLNGKDSITAENGGYAFKVTDTRTGKGMTSHGSVKLYGGAMDLEDSYEGIEGLTVEIYGGSWYVVSEDDGINAREKTETTTTGTATTGTKTAAGTAGAAAGAGKAAGTGAAADAGKAAGTGVTAGTGNGAAAPGANGGRMGGGMAGGRGAMQDNPKCLIKIAGGLVQVDAKGDGLDSNGELSITGGETYVSGPVSNGDGSLDFNGTGTISGGTFLGAGSSGMPQDFSDTSTQNSITVYAGSTVKADTKISVTDASGKEILSWTPGKDYSCIQVSSPDLKKGESYTVTAGTEKQTVAVSAVNNSAGTRQGNGQGGMRGGPGGMKGMNNGNGNGTGNGTNSSGNNAGNNNGFPNRQGAPNGQGGPSGTGRGGKMKNGQNGSDSAQSDGTLSSGGNTPPAGGPGAGSGNGGPMGNPPDGESGGPGGNGDKPPMDNPPDGQA